MDSATQETIVMLAGIVAAVMVAQTILMVVVAVAFRKWCQRTGSTVEQLARSAEPVLQNARELLGESREKIAAITSNLSEVTALAKSQALRIDGFLKDTTDRAQFQIVRLDHLLSDTMDRVDETTQVIQHGILKPVREVSAVAAGVRAALEYFASRKRKTVEHAHQHQDEEMFI